MGGGLYFAVCVAVSRNMLACAGGILIGANDRKVPSQMITTEKKQEVIAGNRIHEKDTGSAEIQIALLTARINELTGHLQSHRKDFSSRRGLLKMVGRRSSLLKYLTSTDPKRYQDVITRLGLRK